MDESNEKKSAFEQVTENSNRGVIGEFWDFLKYSKKWWLTPVLIAVLLFGALVIVSGSSIAPLIYAFW